jgi:PAS domain S-box-containing protein
MRRNPSQLPERPAVPPPPAGGAAAEVAAELVGPAEFHLDRAREAVIAMDAGERIIFLNPAAERLYGVAAHAARGREFSDLFSAVMLTSPADARAQRLPGPLLLDGRATHLTRDGRSIPVQVTLIPITDRAGCAGRAAIIREDREFASLVEQGDEGRAFEKLLAGLSTRFSGITEDKIDGEIQFWLEELAAMLGADRGSFTEITPAGEFNVTHAYAGAGITPQPKGIADHALPWLTGQFRAGKRVVLTRLPDDLPVEAVKERDYFGGVGMRSGIGLPVYVSGALICVLTFSTFRRYRTWPNDLISRLQLAGDVFANALSRRDTKHRLSEKRDELAHVGRVAAMGELASVIAHELDQPLTAVVTNAGAVRHWLSEGQADPAETDEALKDIIDAAMRASEIVRRERRLLRRTQLSFEPLDLSEAVREVEIFIRGAGRQEGARVTLELAGGLPPVAGDRIQLQQVVLNLVRNGIQVMKDQPRERRELKLRTGTNDGSVTLSVSDAGPPVDPAVLQRMFEPFYTTKVNGLGMGLSISRSIVEAHHGRIWATPNEGGGLTMHVAIPPGSASHVNDDSDV